jgi:hypothetical protein
VPHPGKQPADFAILTVTQPDFKKCAVAFRADPLHPMDVESALAKIESLFQRGKGLVRGAAGNLDSIRPRHLKPRMSHAMGQFTVVGQENQTFAALVQSANGEQSQFTRRHQVDCARPALGIAAGAQVAARLVQQEVSRRIAPHQLSVDAHFLLLRINARAQIADDLAVYADSSVDDVFFAFAARTESGRGEEPLEAHALRSKSFLGRRTAIVTAGMHKSCLRDQAMCLNQQGAPTL